MGKRSLPPGFRFHPTDVELVMYYLKRKVMGKRIHCNFIAEVDIYKHDPWDLPAKSRMPTRDLKWYFFCPIARKYGTGERQNRATDQGYWKTTGKDRSVNYKNEVVGMIKTLVFHTGKAPRGNRTDWVMHEYKLKEKDLVDMDAYVLSVIFHKDGPGPRNGAQYGAPFVEEDWSDDEEDGSLDSASFASLFTQTNFLPHNQGSSVATSSRAPKSTCSTLVSEFHSAEVTPLVQKMLPPVPENDVFLPENPDNRNLQLPDDDILPLLEMLTDDGAFIPCADNDADNEVPSKNMNEQEFVERSETALCVDGSDIYNGLVDLDFLNEYDFSCAYGAYNAMDEMLPSGDSSYLELNDLNVPLEFPSREGENGCTNNDMFAQQDCYNNFQQFPDAGNSVGGYLHSTGPSDPFLIQVERPFSAPASGSCSGSGSFRAA